jgi:DNA-binding NarL/FixJ family response regulator
MILVAIADNNPVVHIGINAFFKNSADFQIVANLNSYNETQLLLEKTNIDIIIFDYELKNLDSLTNLKKLVNQYPKTKFIIFTNLSENIYVSNMLNIGIKGYISKNENLDILNIAIKKVANGEIYLHKKMQYKIENLNKLNKKDRITKKLSTREIEVLKYLSQGKKNKEISEILALDQKTISTYKLRLLAKLGVTNLVDLVNKAKNLDVL